MPDEEPQYENPPRDRYRYIQSAALTAAVLVDLPSSRWDGTRRRRVMAKPMAAYVDRMQTLFGRGIPAKVELNVEPDRPVRPGWRACRGQKQGKRH